MVTPFTVAANPIASWFGQPGHGLQYKLESTYLPQAGTELSVDWLLRNGYLVEELPGQWTDGDCYQILPIPVPPPAC